MQYFYSVVSYAFYVGMVWFFAWAFNPSISSGTVWFIAFVTGMILNNIWMGRQEALSRRR